MAYTDEEKKLATTVDEQLALKPGEFVWDNQQLLDDATDKWLNREKFSYDYANDPLYQQYKEQYTALGNLAMQDTIGQASALTGGYANSYAQTAGQQTYQSYLQQLNNVMPELYGMAYDRYQAEGQDLYNQMALLESQRSQAYGEWQDQYSEWQNYLNFLYQQERDAVADAQWQKQYELSAANAYGGGGGGGYIAEDIGASDLKWWTDQFKNADTKSELEALHERMVIQGFPNTANSLFYEYSNKLSNSTKGALPDDLASGKAGEFADFYDNTIGKLPFTDLPGDPLNYTPWKKK